MITGATLSSALPTALRGRESELEILRARVRRYGDEGKGGALLIRGVKGVGKSVLLLAVAQLAESEIRARVLRGSRSAGCGVLESLLLARLGLGHESGAVEREEKLRGLLAQTFEDRRVGELASLMGVRLGLVTAYAASGHQGPAASQTDAEIALWKRFFTAENNADRTRPLVLILDDLGASPADERALVEGIAAGGEVLVLGAATAFPGDDRVRAEDTVMQLGPLSDKASRAFLMDQLGHCPDSDLVDELHGALQEFAGGHPGLMLEALSMYERLGVVERGPIVTQIVPEKLTVGGVAVSAEQAAEYSLFKFRPDVQQVLGWAAALGTVFWSRALVTTCRYAEGRQGNSWTECAARIESRVNRALAEGVDAGVLLRMGAGADGGDAEYAFRGTHERTFLLKQMSVEVRTGVARAYAEYLSQATMTHTHEDSLRTLAEARETAGDLRRAGEAFAMAADVARARGSLARAVDMQSEAIRCFGVAAGADGELAGALEKQLDYLVATRSFEMVLRVAEELLDVSFRLVRRGSAAFALARKGRALRELGQPEQSQRAYNDACELFRADGDPRGEASVLDELGRLAWLRGDTLQATAQLESSLAIRRALGDSRLIAMSAHNLGLVARDLGQHTRAADYFGEALRLRRESGELPLASASLVGLARCHMALGDLVGASRVVEEAKSIYTSVVDAPLLAPVRLLVADLAASRQDWIMAHGAYKDAERLATELGDMRLSAEVRAGLVSTTLALGDSSAAYALSLDGVMRARQWGDPSALAGALRLLAEVQSVRGEQSDAANAAREAEVLFASAAPPHSALLSIPPTGR